MRHMKNITKLSIFLFIFAAVIFSAGFACLPVGTASAQQYYNYNYQSCNYHAYRDCVGSMIYWYDSCANRQDLYQNCSGFGQTCQYGQCVLNYNPAPSPVPNPYVVHYRTACSQNNLYWYDSLGTASGLYKNCQDANSCTIDACSSNKCSNTLKCDGSTCATGSADYNNYCASQNPAPAPTPAPTPAPSANALSIIFSAKKDATAPQWGKTVEVAQNSTVYFMATMNNSSNSQINNASFSVNIPSEISMVGNLKVDSVAFSGDIISGVNIGSLGAGSSKSITFEGKTQTFSAQGQKSAVAMINLSGATQSDFVTLNFNPSQSAPAAVASASASSGFVEFLKRWYLWILVAIVLVFLFVVVFRRLSTNV